MTQTYDDEAPAPLASCPVEYVRTMPEAISALRNQDLLNSDRMFAGVYADPGEDSEICLREFVQNDITFTNGERHRERRKLLNLLVRPDALAMFSHQVIVPQSAALLPQLATGPHPDGHHRLNLVPFVDTVFTHFTAGFIGLVNVDTVEQIERLRTLVAPITAAFTSAFYKNRPAIREAGLVAKAEFIKEFYLPSRDAQRELYERRTRDGTTAPAGEPANFLQLVVSGAHPDYDDEEQAIRESLILFNATVGTSTQTIVNTVADLNEWLAEHPEDLDRCRDEAFLLDAMQESLRLRSPFTAYLFRVAARDTTVEDRAFVAGQEVRISMPVVNRDFDIFGPDAQSFNPHRATPPGNTRRYGLAFSAGTHQCLGQRLVMGSDGTGGAHLAVLKQLFDVGVRPDPDNPPQILERSDNLPKPTDTTGAQVDVVRWTSYPVVLDRWPPSTD